MGTEGCLNYYFLWIDPQERVSHTQHENMFCVNYHLPLSQIYHDENHWYHNLMTKGMPITASIHHPVLVGTIGLGDGEGGIREYGGRDHQPYLSAPSVLFTIIELSIWISTRIWLTIEHIKERGDIMNTAIILRLLAQMQQFRQHDQWTRQQLESYQQEKLHQLRTAVYERSPFYQRFHHGLMDRPLQELPVLTKAMLMEHFDTLVTDRSIHLHEVQEHVANVRGDERFLGRYWVNATSGSTGHPGIFLFNRTEWTTVLTSFARAREWAGIEATIHRRVRTAIVASTTPWHMSARAGATLHSIWLPELRLSATEPLETLVQRLNAWQPESLVCYASMARILADEQLAGHLHIMPRQVLPSSEVLTPDTRRRVEQAWGQVLFNQYAATETGSIAAECEHHMGMHLLEDFLMIEVVDHANRPVPPGVYGEKLLVTVLFNRTQPLIRYEISDSVRLSQAMCPSGRPYRLIDAVQGRMEEVLAFPATAGGTVQVQPLVFSELMDTIPVSGWQIVQETNGLSVLLSGIRGEFSDEALARTIQQALAKQGAVIPSVTAQRVATIPKTAQGKAPLIRSHLADTPSH